MTGTPRDASAPEVPPSTGLASGSLRTGSAVGSEQAALQRLEASRTRIRDAMAAHLRDTTVPVTSSPSAPRSFGQRLIERMHRLPVIRTVLAIRGLRRD